MGEVISLSSKQPDVHYSVHITQGYDGHLEVFVEEISPDPESRKRAADAMRRAADMIENGEPRSAS